MHLANKVWIRNLTCLYLVAKVRLQSSSTSLVPLVALDSVDRLVSTLDVRPEKGEAQEMASSTRVNIPQSSPYIPTKA